MFRLIYPFIFGIHFYLTEPKIY